MSAKEPLANLRNETPSKVMAASPARNHASTQSALPGVVSLHEIYTIAEARRRLGWTESAMRAARRRGLKLLTCGKRRYVTGQEILRFMEQINPGA